MGKVFVVEFRTVGVEWRKRRDITYSLSYYYHCCQGEVVILHQINEM